MDTNTPIDFPYVYAGNYDSELQTGGITNFFVDTSGLWEYRVDFMQIAGIVGLSLSSRASITLSGIALISLPLASADGVHPFPGVAENETVFYIGPSPVLSLEIDSTLTEYEGYRAVASLSRRPSWCPVSYQNPLPGA
jgi:hypothetical protein